MLWVCACVCEKSFVSTVQPQHPDEVSLIGSQWDSSAAFSQWIPARRQQVGSDGAALSKRAKDGRRCFLFSSALCFPFTPHTCKRVQALTGRKQTNKQRKKKLVRVPANSRFSTAAFLNDRAESGTLGTTRKPSVCHPRIIVACLLPASS